MCGIIGSTQIERAALERAATTFAYRGPDATAYYFDAEVALGHHRLSIIDVSTRADQPMWDQEKSIGIVFNGEIYNFQALKTDLEKKYSFTTTSDTEVLIYAYREWGTSFVERLRGMFACAIYDTRTHELFLYRDAMGIKPIYYAYDQGFFAFSSELKGLTMLFQERGISLSVEKEALEEYSVFGYIPSPRTLYHSIRKLPRSSWLRFDLVRKSSPEIYRYQYEDPVCQNEPELAALIEERMLEHLIADVPVGVFFSGGTDSSLIASILQKHQIKLKTYSIRMNGKEEDAKYFEAISKKLGIQAEVYSFDVKEFDEVYPLIMTRLDEPLCDNSLFPTYYLSRQAAKEVKVVLSGEGGDELFLGYPRDLVLQAVGKKLEGYTWLDRLYTALPFFPAKNKLFEHLFIWARQPLSYYLTHMSPARGFLTASAWKRVKSLITVAGTEPLALDREWYLENDLLKKLDIATSYASIEGRVPLLDRGIVANAARYQHEHLQDGVLKAILKRILTRYLPSELVYRGKSGFGMNLHRYFASSRYLRTDLLAAIAYLPTQGMQLPRGLATNPDRFIRRAPNYCFGLVMLFHALKNVERAWGV